MECNHRQVAIDGGLAAAPGMGVARQLIALDGEPRQPGDQVGAEQRRARIQGLIRTLGDDPVDMLNLLRFKPGGEASYQSYGVEFAKLIPKHAPGTEVVYWAECAGLLVGTEEWDRLIIVHYPSIKAFLKITASPDYERIAHLRTDALERAVLYAMVPIGRTREE